MHFEQNNVSKDVSNIKKRPDRGEILKFFEQIKTPINQTFQKAKEVTFDLSEKAIARERVFDCAFLPFFLMFFFPPRCPVSLPFSIYSHQFALIVLKNATKTQVFFCNDFYKNSLLSRTSSFFVCLMT